MVWEATDAGSAVCALSRFTASMRLRSSAASYAAAPVGPRVDCFAGFGAFSLATCDSTFKTSGPPKCIFCSAHTVYRLR